MEYISNPRSDHAQISNVRLYDLKKQMNKMKMNNLERRPKLEDNLQNISNGISHNKVYKCIK